MRWFLWLPIGTLRIKYGLWAIRRGADDPEGTPWGVAWSVATGETYSRMEWMYDMGADKGGMRIVVPRSVWMKLQAEPEIRKAIQAINFGEESDRLEGRIKEDEGSEDPSWS